MLSNARHTSIIVYHIGARVSPACPCSKATETIDHFLSRCTKWATLRYQILQHTYAKWSNLSYHLGGKGPSDPDDWTPDLQAAKSIIEYAIATGRLEQDSP